MGKRSCKTTQQRISGLKPKEKEIIVRRTGRTAVINSFETEQIEILAEGELIEENWVTREVNMKEIERVMDQVAKGFSKDFRLETERKPRVIMRNSSLMAFPS